MPSPGVHERLARTLVTWFESRDRDVPGRSESDPYRIWIAEVMAQQTRIATVRERYTEFLGRFPDVHALAEAELDAVLKAWEGMGYYARARNLHRAARVLVEEHKGLLPDDPAALRSLPGIGPYTAGAIASIAFDRAEPAVDGNVRRVLSRLFDLERPSAAALESESRRLLATDGVRPGTLNQALMDFGGSVCTPRRPDCDACPLAADCLAFKHDTQASRPGRSKSVALPHHPIAVAVLRKEGRVLIGKRPEHGLLGGLWEFPGGKIEAGEAPRQAAARELQEEMCIEATIGRSIAVIPHAFSHFRITLHAFEAAWVSGEPCGRAVTEWRWVRPEELSAYAFPAANRDILAGISGASDRP
ncbi:MAG: A/G-specific adenine glycosylase [marine benthic group bacterium]|nr:A/G-specific adenine glycosylase [Gemmatimonadota bacterium]MCL7975817.1 A/G-specific adenine glycosylase [Gemmatimonadota bacterium]MCL7979657.1 A/G-specific adenine glycosylase [Gemmatimonadota bacterium]